MNATSAPYQLGQSLWLDNITRDLLMQGTLKHYIEDLSVTGLTSNPTIFEQAFSGSSSSDHGNATNLLSRDGGDCESTLASFTDVGIHLDQLAADLQSQGAIAFIQSWKSLMSALESKTTLLRTAN